MTLRLNGSGGDALGSGNFPQGLGDLDPMITGLCLLAACAGYVVWSGTSRERSRALTGKKVTVPPKMTTDEYLDALDKHRSA